MEEFFAVNNQKAIVVVIPGFYVDYSGLYPATHSGVNPASDSGANPATFLW